MSVRRILRDASGATAVETALVLPVLCLLLAGLIQLGWGLHCASKVRWALERSTRNALLDPDYSQAKLIADVSAQVPEVLRTGRLTVAMAREPSGGSTMVRTTARYDYNLVIPFAPVLSLPFQAEAYVPLTGAPAA